LITGVKAYILLNCGIESSLFPEPERSGQQYDLVVALPCPTCRDNVSTVVLAKAPVGISWLIASSSRHTVMTDVITRKA